jgi:hypothetical protein
MDRLGLPPDVRAAIGRRNVTRILLRLMSI